MDGHYITAAGERRAELAHHARWAAAGDVVREVLGQAPEPGVGRAPALPSLVYLPGGPGTGEPGDERASPPGARGRAAEALMLANRGVRRSEAVALAMRSLEESGGRDVTSFRCALMTLIYADELAGAERACAEATSSEFWTRTAERRDVLALVRGRILARTGALREAAILLAKAAAGGACRRLAVAWLVEVLVELGEVVEATDLLHVHGLLGPIRDDGDRTAILAARGALALATGRFDSGLDDFLTCGRALGDWGVFNPAVVRWRSPAALCASALHHRDLAVSLAQQELFHAGAWGTAWTRATALHALGLSRCDESGIRHLREAAAKIFDGATRTEQVRVCFDLGVFLWRRFSFEEAEKALVLARDLADAAGSGIWADRARAAVRQVRRAGDAPTVTDSEARIGSMARAGLSNKEIAERANLTVGTVEQHLSSVYRKLGIPGRSDLVYAMTDPCFAVGG
ncbi:LuxR C-terminal-related transcriptional regulator [Amycolatopsis sp. NPDC098790]|uniref:helix-turn-helix transcriptional regulator n=1 Tax=Amycolatopsis sp. NPDC098790 TaxID=3363939 RepID=UPI00381CF0D3